MMAQTSNSKLYRAIAAVSRSVYGVRSCYVLHYRVFGSNSCSGPACDYNSDWIELSSRKRIAPSLLVSAITKRTRPCFEVSA